MIDMQKIFFDSDVLLDVLLERKEHMILSQEAWKIVETSTTMEQVTSAVIVANIHYLTQRHFDKKYANEVVQALIAALHIVDVNGDDVLQAIQSDFTDFEDAIQYFSAVRQDVATIVTRNVNDYATAEDIPVLTPQQFVAEAKQ